MRMACRSEGGISVKATRPQIMCAIRLCRELGYDPEDYALVSMSQEDIRKLIGELRSELEG